MARAATKRAFKLVANAANSRCGSWRRQGLPLLHDVGDQNSGSGVTGLATRMRRFGRNLEAVARLDHTGGLALNRKLEAAF